MLYSIPRRRGRSKAHPRYKTKYHCETSDHRKNALNAKGVNPANEIGFSMMNLWVSRRPVVDPNGAMLHSRPTTIHAKFWLGWHPSDREVHRQGVGQSETHPKWFPSRCLKSAMHVS